MLKKRIIGLVCLIFLIGFVFAEVDYCCEKTDDGAWCQSAPQNKCDNDYRSLPASCEATSYCNFGCCYDSHKGTCKQNVGQTVCNKQGGVWDDEESCEIPQCELGCCLMQGQVSFVTLVECKRQSVLYGIETDYRSEINNLLDCYSVATADVEGACVFEKEFEKNCKRTTKGECNDLKSDALYSNVDFYGGSLCTDEKLGTVCSKTENTICYQDRVHYVDSCGNIGNIYDSTKYKDSKSNERYWSEILSLNESCGYGSGNVKSRTCGNCNYYPSLEKGGSTCEKYEKGSKPIYGDYVCADLNCEYNDVEYSHGETWCEYSSGRDSFLPGSRDFRMLCYNGEVLVEPCADFRQEVCIQSQVGEEATGYFKTANCIVNKWQPCTGYTEEDDCEKESLGYCTWSNNMCVPEFTPGLNFWVNLSSSTSTDSSAGDICSGGSATCTITKVKKRENIFTNDWEVEEGEECLDGAWEADRLDYCRSLGDCDGASLDDKDKEKNWLGF